MTDLNQFLNKGLTANDVTHTNGYASIASGAGAGGLSMTQRQKFRNQPRTVGEYRYSRLGSQGSSVKVRTADQKRGRVYDASNDTFDDSAVTGNRRHGGVSKLSGADGRSIERRQHFIEPPARTHDRYA